MKCANIKHGEPGERIRRTGEFESGLLCHSVKPTSDEAGQNIEMVQWRAVRYVTNRHSNTSSVGNMLELLGWDNYELRRKKL